MRNHTLPYITSPGLTRPQLSLSDPYHKGRNTPYHTSPHSFFQPLARGLHKRMFILMTFMTCSFQVRWMIASVLGKFQNVMTMCFVILRQRLAVLANAAISFVNPLFQGYPKVKRHSPEPSKAQTRKFIYCKNSHTSTHHTGHRITYSDQSRTYPTLTTKKNPYHTLPEPAKPRIAQPYRNLSHLTLSTNTEPHHATLNQYLTKPDPAKHHLSAPLRTKAKPQHKSRAIPYPTEPIRAIQNLACPRHSEPDPTLATKLFMNLIFNHAEPSKLGAIVPNANGFSSKHQNILQQVGLNFIVKTLNFKREYPSCFEGWANTDYPRALNNDRAHVQVKWLIRIGVQFGRDRDIVWDAFRVNDDVCDNQILVGFSALSGNLKVDRRLYKRAFDVTGWLINTPMFIGIKILSPFLSIVLRSGGLMPTLAHGRQIRHWEAMLHKRRNPFDGTINCIHFFSLKQRTAIFRVFTILSRKAVFHSKNNGSLSVNKKTANFLDKSIVTYPAIYCNKEFYGCS